MAPIRCCFDQTAVWHSDAARGPSTPSFDHLVGARKQRLGNVEAKRFGGLEVDDQLELDRSLNWKVGGFGALENTIDIGSRSSVEVVGVHAIGHQGTGNGGVAECKQYRHPVLLANSMMSW